MMQSSIKTLIPICGAAFVSIVLAASGASAMQCITNNSDFIIKAEWEKKWVAVVYPNGMRGKERIGGRTLTIAPGSIECTKWPDTTKKETDGSLRVKLFVHTKEMARRLAVPTAGAASTAATCALATLTCPLTGPAALGFSAWAFYEHAAVRRYMDQPFYLAASSSSLTVKGSIYEPRVIDTSDIQRRGLSLST